MSRLIRRGRASLASDPADTDAEVPGSSRRAFLRSSAGVATVVAIPTAAVMASHADAAEDVAKAVPNPSTPAASGAVMAYVHDAKRGDVVVVHGTTQWTVRDPELVRRLLTPPHKARAAKPARKREGKAAPKPTQKKRT